MEHSGLGSADGVAELDQLNESVLVMALAFGGFQAVPVDGWVWLLAD